MKCDRYVGTGETKTDMEESSSRSIRPSVNGKQSKNRSNSPCFMDKYKNEPINGVLQVPNLGPQRPIESSSPTPSSATTRCFIPDSDDMPAKKEVFEGDDCRCIVITMAIDDSKENKSDRSNIKTSIKEYEV